MMMELGFLTSRKREWIIFEQLILLFLLSLIISHIVLAQTSYMYSDTFYVTRVKKICHNCVGELFLVGLLCAATLECARRNVLLLRESRVTMQMWSLRAEIISWLYVTACGKQSL